MKTYFLDTSVVVNYLRNKTKAVDFIKETECEFVSSYICMAELYEGIARLKNGHNAQEDVENFFMGMGRVYGLDREISITSGEIRAQLKKKGKFIEDIDIFIAATCLVNNLILVTANPKHFERVEGLKILSLAEDE